LGRISLTGFSSLICGGESPSGGENFGGAKMSKTHGFLRILLFLFLAGIILTAFLLCVQFYVKSLSKNRMVTPETAPECDAIIVLGAFVSENQPSPVLEDRLLYAYRLYEAKKAPKILVSGDHGQHEYDEVNTMKNWLIQKGVPRENIFLDHAGFDTYDTMYRAKKIFGIKSAIISTQDFHIGRSLYIARRLGIDAWGYPSEDKPLYPMEVYYVREWLAREKAFLDTDILRRKPKFEGEAIPISGNGLLTDG
jgi:vancomycin permeability regulator SanA